MRQADAAELRRDLRAFLAAEIAMGGFDPGAGSWGAADPGFAVRLGARGFIGNAWPRALGGRDGSAVDRHVIAEELIARGAPLRASWVAEWLAGPLLLAGGTPEQQREVLPRFAAGRLAACIGLTEAALPGMDAPRCLARPDRGGWRLSGRCRLVGDALGRLLLLARTGEEGAGLSLFLVDLALPGIIPLGVGRLGFDGLFLAADRLVGAEDEALPLWHGVAGIAHGAPAPWLRHLSLLGALAEADGPPELEPVLGRLLASTATLRAMGLARAGRASPGLAALAAQEAEVIPAALLRLLPEEARPGAGSEHPPELPPVPIAPHSLRRPHPLAVETGRLLAGRLASGFDAELWAALEDGSVLRAALPPELGGEGEGLPGLLAIAEAAGAAGAPLPVAETLLGHHALALAGLAPPIGPLTIGPVHPGDAPRFERGLLAGRLRRLPWARHAAAAVIVLHGRRTILAGRPAIGAEDRNGAGEPRDLVLLDEMPVLAAGPPGIGLTPEALLGLGALFRAAAMLGALGRLAKGRRARALAGAARFALRQAARDPSRFAIACACLRIQAAAEAALASPGGDAALGRRIAAWSGEFGTESEWASWLGGQGRRAGAGGLWSLIADRGRMPGETEETEHE